MKKRALRKPPKGPANLAARALGKPIFGLRIVGPKKGYSRKLKHRAVAAILEDDEAHAK